MFHTLQDFLHHTKGISYLIAGAILLAFIFFWFFLTGREEK
jgi:hypothetical protein